MKPVVTGEQPLSAYSDPAFPKRISHVNLCVPSGELRGVSLAILLPTERNTELLCVVMRCMCFPGDTNKCLLTPNRALETAKERGPYTQHREPGTPSGLLIKLKETVSLKSP